MIIQIWERLVSSVRTWLLKRTRNKRSEVNVPVERVVGLEAKCEARKRASVELWFRRGDDLQASVGCYYLIMERGSGPDEETNVENGSHDCVVGCVVMIDPESLSLRYGGCRGDDGDGSKDICGGW